MPTEAHDEFNLIEASKVVVHAGLLSLSAGTGSYRVKETMRHIAEAVGIQQHHAHVTLTEITSTSHCGTSFRTEVAETRAIGVNAARLQSLQDLTARLRGQPGHSTADQVAAELKDIANQRPQHHAVLNALCAGAVCASLSFLIGGSPAAIGSALLAASTGQYVRRILLHRGLNQLGVTMLTAVVASAVFLLAATIVDTVMHQQGSRTGYVAAVLFLIPGFPLVTAGLDLARLNLSAGIARLTYAVMLTMSAGIVIWGVSVAVNLTPGASQQLVLPSALMLTLQATASFLGAASFAVMFNGTWRMAGLAGGCCLIANMLRLQLIELGINLPTATATAAFLVGLLTAAIAPRLRIPRITLSVPAVLIMMPGALVYHAIYALTQSDTTDIISSLTQAALTIAALPFGIVIARILTDREWAFDR